MTSSAGFSGFPLETVSCSRAWWPEAPSIVAEVLAPVPVPILTGLDAGPSASAAEVARAIAHGLLPPEDSAPAPPWLLPGQVRSFRRVLAALRRFGAALLADPVGSGKTFVALAVAGALARREPAICLVPAPLASQWRGVAASVAAPVVVSTHQQASRGHLPGGRGLVIIDESHGFRHPRTHRYEHVASWLLGRRVLLLSATPVVNRLEDLAHQLLLGARDDALQADGIVSLRSLLASGASSPALGALVIEERGERGPRPRRRTISSPACTRERAVAEAAMRQVDRLRLSCHPPIAALVRSAFRRAIGSSAAAYAAALRRYRSLLLHAQDAARAGRALTRAELRSFVGELDDQLVLWELLGESGAEAELALDDLARLDPLIADAGSAPQAHDPKAERLRAIVTDGVPTLVFCTRRETVRHLRQRLGPPPVAWCTGDRAGLGHTSLPRPVVLGWFRNDTPPPRAGAPSSPTCLVVTEVAAEGLDLQRAARVVHYDLPWTPMRLEQREGRAVRLGSTHGLVEVVQFLPPPALDRALGLGDRLRRKAALPAIAGLGSAGSALWGWRTALAERLGEGPAAAGVARVAGRGTGVLAGFTLHGLTGGRSEPLAAVAGWLDARQGWTEDPEVIAERLVLAASAEDMGPVPASAVRRALEALATPVRARLALAGTRRWSGAEPTTEARRLAAIMHEAVRSAARERDTRRLAALERGLAFASGGHTAGEAALVRRLAELEPAKLGPWLDRLPPPTPRWDAVEVRLGGLLIFEG